MPGAAVKTLHAIGLLAKPESTYLGGGSLSVSTDGIQLAYESPEGAPLSYSEVFDGRRSINPGGPLPLRQLTPGAREVRGTLPFQWKGNNSAVYGASVKPHLHDLMLACGLVGAFGSSKWTYTVAPGPTGFTSLLMALLCAGENWPVTGAYLNWKWSAEGGGPIKDEFDMVGLLGDPTDSSAATTVVYPTQTLDPPKADSMIITIGSFLLPTVRRISFDLGRSIDNRRADVTQAGASAGFQPGVEIIPKFNLQIDRTALVGTPFHTSGGLDPYKMRRDGTVFSFFVQRGGTQYNRLKKTLAQAQITSAVTVGGDQAGAFWDLEITPHNSTPIANDGLLIEAD